MATNSRHLSLDAVVLHLQNYSESHRFVDVLSASQGRLTLLARGARASKKRFAGVLDLFADLKLQCTRKQDRWYLESADLISARASIRTKWEAYLLASIFCECTRVLLPEAQSSMRAYRALRQGLNAINGNNWPLALSYLPSLLRIVGLLPDCHRCLTCHRKLSIDEHVVLDANGVICSRCQKGTQSVIPVFSLWGEPLAELEYVLPTERFLNVMLSWIEEQTTRKLKTRACMPTDLNFFLQPHVNTSNPTRR